MSWLDDRSVRPAWVEIDLGALRHNLAAIRTLAPDARVLAVLKADAYGHGAVAVGRALQEEGVDAFAVALLEEGVELRGSGIRGEILVLGVISEAQFASMSKHELTPTISSLRQLRSWADWSTANSARPLPFHLKVDTGMNRLGLTVEEVGEALAITAAAPKLRLAGLLSHLIESETLHSRQNARQERRFHDLVRGLPQRQGVLVHLANSGATLHRATSRFSMVRPGLALYGLDPAGVLQTLRPVMSVRSQIVLTRHIEVGETVGYGARFQARRPSRIGIVPVGYADGLPWRLGPHGEALAGGRRVPYAGAVSMDMLALDLTDCDATTGSAVTLLGADPEAPGAALTAAEIASRCGTIPYEVLCGLGLRLPKLYLDGGREPVLVSRFERRAQPGLAGEAN